ncbi:amino acid adenylation domain-containing protein [Ideonella sp. 4Y16]|uniref:Amino acid adenylation domain-containing protein n=1 Tax=Ideonella alba TaxID=2824118 RepID=A0A940YHM9_9BURK|nr:non-ribosomal peptide synthetase [Ideonella alba]MBQ0933566.1 amino acid adenylation domain-containing protein [Ideonella alba]MBQ0946376.1 amino acid adenylation domain-containing protein [Ideonella alba]
MDPAHTDAPARCAVRDSNSIQERFEHHARTSPDAVALVCGAAHTTYGQLNRKANQLAHYLRGLGMTRGSLVGVWLPRSSAAIEALLGILKAGCGYVPIEADCPSERLAHQLRETEARVLVTDGHRIARLPHGIQARSVCLDDIVPDLATQSPRDPVGQSAPGDVAYCMFSSGSTGAPKGILTPHAGVLRLVCEPDYVHLDAKEVLLHAAPLAFDASTFELWGALLNGGTVAILEPGPVNPETIAAAIELHRVTTAWLTAPLFHRIGAGHFEGMSSLRQLLAGGDVLMPSAVARALKALPGCRLVNGYGPTETTTFAICGTVSSQEAASAVPLGNPINETWIHILDEQLEPVQPGEVGEIHIAGSGLARGYLNCPDLTAEKFIPNPYGPPGSRMYRSGDLGARLADGRITFAGRIDHQVKINGHRVELGEIEAVVAREPGVHEAVVVAWERVPGERRLVCYLTAAPGRRLTVEGLRDGLAHKLPHYMIPSAWTVLDAMPHGPSGKIDRRSLPPPGSGRDGIATAYVAPKPGLETRLAELWAEVLRLDRVGRLDQFATLGGNSIQAIDLSFRAGRKLFGGHRVPAPLGNMTLSEFAQACIAVLDPHGQDAFAADSAGSTPCASQAQHQVWFLEQLGEGWRAYRFHARFNFRGALDVPALQTALVQLVDRHEILRTAFIQHDGELFRQVSQRLEVPLPVVDLSALPLGKREPALQAHIAAELAHRFDISQAPLARWLLLRMAQDEHVLLQSEHHFLHDGQSFRILVRDLSTLYSAATTGSAAGLPQIEAQYGDYCCEERAWLQSAEFRAQLSAWRGALASSDPQVRLFSNRPRPPRRQGIGAQARRPLAAELVRAVDTVAASLGVTRFALMFSAFGLLCGRHSNEQRFVIGTALANRTAAKHQWTTGMFVNMLPLPFDCAPRMPFEAFAHATSAAIDFALTHSRVPLGEIVKALNLSATLQGEPPFNVGFSFHDSLEAQPRFGELVVDVDEAIAIGSAKFDLDVVVIAGNPGKGEGLELLFEYSTDCLDEASVERLLDHYVTLLHAISADSRRCLQDLSVLPSSERRLLLRDFVDTSEGWDLDRCVHELFELQADAHPGATAVVAGAHRVSYGELERRANRLAHCLRSCGVGPEVAVVACVERGVELIVALLGILKAGGVYVPLDPGYPAERRDGVLADTGAPVLLTTARHAPALRSSAARVIVLDGGDDNLSGQSSERPLNVSRPGHLAYCIFTSGSTGRPKGVGVSNRSLVNHAWSHCTACALTASDRVLQICSCGFDASLEEIVPTLLVGATLVIAPPELRAPDEEFLAWMAAEELTVLDLPTAFWAALVTHADDRSRIPHSVRITVIGGEAAKWEHVERWQRLTRHPDFTLFNTYGPTEATIIATRGRVDPTDRPPSGTSVPLGRSISNVRVYVLDANLEPTAFGVPGEICIGGAGVARGYLNLPGLTAEKFVPDPYGAPGERLYRTGDQGFYRPDGNIEFLGRTDSQVKIRGFRVEPGEVEAVLVGLPGVRGAAISAHPGGSGDLQLVGYLVTADGAALDLDAVRAQLAQRLPEYMLPGAWVFLQHLPLSRNGKVDRLQLPPPEPSSADRASIECPAVDAECPTLPEVIEILRELMPSIAIEPDDDLLRNGMHSVQLLRLVAACKSRLGVQLKVRDLYRLATPRAIALHIEDIGVTLV